MNSNSSRLKVVSYWIFCVRSVKLQVGLQVMDILICHCHLALWFHSAIKDCRLFQHLSVAALVGHDVVSIDRSSFGERFNVSPARIGVLGNLTVYAWEGNRVQSFLGYPPSWINWIYVYIYMQCAHSMLKLRRFGFSWGIRLRGSAESMCI
jgi:hypothetical protein